MSERGERQGRDDIRGTDAQLLDALVDGLAPVRRVAPLRIRLGIVLAVGVGVFFATIGIAGVRPDFEASLVRRPEFLATWIGLIGLVLGGAMTALAAATPGRDSVRRRGQQLALVGLGGAVLACTAVAATIGFSRETTLAADLMCLRQSMLFGVLPALAIVGAVVSGWVERSRMASVSALAAGAGFGALMVHLACGGDGAVHLLIGHLSVPILASLALGLPLAFALQRWGR